MEHAPNIVLFWYFIISIFVLMLALMIMAIILIKKKKEQNAKNMQLLAKMCVGLGGIYTIPIILVVGYIVYLYIG